MFVSGSLEIDSVLVLAFISLGRGFLDSSAACFNFFLAKFWDVYLSFRDLKINNFTNTDHFHIPTSNNTNDLQAKTFSFSFTNQLDVSIADVIGVYPHALFSVMLLC